MGMNQSMFVSFPKALHALSAASAGSNRVTIRLRLRDNHREHYTNIHVVLHASTHSNK
jgi:hypothetical protein